MKKTIVLFAFFPFYALAQVEKEPAFEVFPLKDSVIYYEKIIEVPNTAKDEIYKRAKIWATSIFKSQKAALQVDDKELGLLSYNTFVEYARLKDVPLNSPILIENKYDFKVNIFIKDNKVKLVINDVANGNDLLRIRSKALKFINESRYGFKKMSTNLMEKEFPEQRKEFIKLNNELTAVIGNFEKMIIEKSEMDF